MLKVVTVAVPATTANLGPGFDCLGLTLDHLERGHGHPGGRRPAHQRRGRRGGPPARRRVQPDRQSGPRPPGRALGAPSGAARRVPQRRAAGLRPRVERHGGAGGSDRRQHPARRTAHRRRSSWRAPCAMRATPTTSRRPCTAASSSSSSAKTGSWCAVSTCPHARDGGHPGRGRQHPPVEGEPTGRRAPGRRGLQHRARGARRRGAALGRPRPPRSRDGRSSPPGETPADDPGGGRGAGRGARSGGWGRSPVGLGPRPDRLRALAPVGRGRRRGHGRDVLRASGTECRTLVTTTTTRPARVEGVPRLGSVARGRVARQCGRGAASATPPPVHVCAPRPA